MQDFAETEAELLSTEMTKKVFNPVHGWRLEKYITKSLALTEMKNEKDSERKRFPDDIEILANFSPSKIFAIRNSFLSGYSFVHVEIEVNEKFLFIRDRIWKLRLKSVENRENNWNKSYQQMGWKRCPHIIGLVDSGQYEQ